MAQGISLHVGLNSVDPNHYAGWSGPLVACEKDARDMKGIADHRGFASSLLLTAAAMRGAVIDGIKQAAAALAPDDIFFLSYSGHGGQAPDFNGDELDFQDETWCLFDGQLLDDELWELWAAFRPGVRILVLSDSCHSGTVTKAYYDGLASSGAILCPVSKSDGDAPRFRAAPNDALLATYLANESFYRGIAGALPTTRSAVGATVRLLSGCQDNQLSEETNFNGVFTAKLLQVWSAGGFQADYAVFHDRIVNAPPTMPPWQTPNHLVEGAPNPTYDAQTPFTI